jgi:hypothetical protein
MPKSPVELVHLLREITASSDHTVVVLEQVHALPQSGRATMFTFGRSYGWIEAACAALNLEVRDVTPQAWMKTVTAKHKKDFATSTLWKAHLHSIALRRYPYLAKDLKKDHADAVLIADYFSQQNNERLNSEPHTNTGTEAAP